MVSSLTVVDPGSTLGADSGKPDTKSKPAAQPYRADLDGLRGVAILLVACFHIWFGRVSGGVDVFLTLSGYFFIGSLLRHAITEPKRSTLGAGSNYSGRRAGY